MNPQQPMDHPSARRGSNSRTPELLSRLRTAGRVLAAALTASVLAACGSGEEKQVSVEATETACTVSPQQASAGSRVTFTVENTGTEPVDFSLVAPEGDTVLKEEGIAPGASEETVQSQLNDQGTYTVVCTRTGASPIRSEFNINE